MDDKKRIPAVRVIAAKKLPVTPLKIIAWYKTEDREGELARLYREFSSVRIHGDWYERDAIEMFLDHRQGRV